MDRFVDSLLAPFARLLVARGIGLADLTERLKHHYLTAALERAGDKPSDSRLSVLTGLQRREVRRLLDAPLEAEKRRPNHLARLVALWQQDAEFAGRVLPRRGPGGFDDLAQRIRRDIHPRTMLDELLAAGTVNVVAGEHVRLVLTSFQPLAGSQAQLDYLADNAGDFLAAATHNVLDEGERFFERAAHYNQLSEEAIATLRAEFEAAEMALLHRVSARAAELQESQPGTRRFRAGGYFYSTEET